MSGAGPSDSEMLNSPGFWQKAPVPHHKNLSIGWLECLHDMPLASPTGSEPIEQCGSSSVYHDFAQPLFPQCPSGYAALPYHVGGGSTGLWVQAGRSLGAILEAQMGLGLTGGRVSVVRRKGSKAWRQKLTDDWPSRLYSAMSLVYEMRLHSANAGGR